MSNSTPKKHSGFLKNFRNSEQYQIVARVFNDNFAQYRGKYILAIFLMIIASAATGGSAFMMREVINSILQANNFDYILYVGLAVIAIFMIKGFATYGHTVTLAVVGNSLSASVQKRVFNHLLSLKVEYFDRTSLGEIFTRANMGVQATRSIIETLIMSVCRDVLTLFFLALVMIIQEPLISLSVLAIGPLSVMFIRGIVKKTRMHAKKQLLDLARSQSLLKETISGITMVKTYSLENEMSNRMSNIIEGLRIRSNRIAKLAARTSPIMESLGGIALGLLVIYSGWWIMEFGTDGIDPDHPGKLMSFITAFLLAYAPAKKLAKLRVSLEKYFVAARYMYDLIDEQKPESLLFNNINLISAPRGEIEMKSVNFSYGSHLPVLHDVTLFGKFGEKIGLVGPSGSGKSTVFKLILALYKPNTGSVKIDGQNVFDATPESVRGLISYVGQETFIYTGSVAENIGFGKLGATKDEIVKAAKLASADGFISRMEDGYDTFVGESGAQLSGGQRQRIAIARAFLKDAPIVLLDEATSSLDTESEQAIQSALDELVEGKTTFIIAHRLSTVQKCDRIYVVANGSIVEQGSHSKLIDDDKIYAQLFKLQFTG
jgi:subfamily B ATP-binding cassette protein MsbA